MSGAGEPVEGDILDSGEAGRRAIRGGLMRVLGFGGGIIALLISTPILTRHLGVADFGIYVTVTSLMTVVAMLSDAGLTVVGVREYSSRDGESRERLLRNLVALRVIVALAGAGVAIAFALASGFPSAAIGGTALAGLGLVLVVIQQAYAVPLTAQLRLGAVTALDLARNVLTAAGVVVGVLLGASLWVFLALPLPVGIVGIVLTAAVIGLRSVPLPGIDREELRYLVRETLPVAIASTIGAFYYRAALIVMSLVATEQQTGYFSASFRILEGVLAVPGLICAAAFPIMARAARDDQDRLAYGLQRLFDVGLILAVLSGIVIVLGARPAIEVLAGDEFAPAVGALRIQAIAIAGGFLVSVWATGLWAVRAQRALAWANLVAVTTAAALVAALVPAYGAEGAAMAMAIAEVGLAGTYAYLLMRRRPELRPSLAIVPRVLVAGAVAAGVLLVPAPDVVLAVLAAVVYLGTLAAVRGIPPELLAAVRPQR